MNNIQSDCYSFEQFNYLFKTNEEYLKIINYNIRSFRKNANSFFPIIRENLPQIITLTETWFSPNYQDEIPGYNSYHIFRQNRRSGGVSVFIREDVEATKIDNLSFIAEHIEVCSVTINIANEKISFILLYRPHEGTIHGFIEELDKILSNSKIRNHRCVVSGDFNIRFELDNAENLNFFECMKSFHMYPTITKPTRFSADNLTLPSLLDMIWTNATSACISGILSHDITDHCPTFLLVPFPNVNGSKSTNESIKLLLG